MNTITRSSAVAFAVMALAACSSSKSTNSGSSTATSSAPASGAPGTGASAAPGGSSTGSTISGPATGSATLSFGGPPSSLAIQLCVDTGGGGVNVTAVGSDAPAPTLTANLASTIDASTLVFTIPKADNSYTIVAMASATGAEAITGGRTGNHIELHGKATQQAYDPTGKAVGTPVDGAVDLVATCRSIEPTQPAPSSDAPASAASGATSDAAAAAVTATAGVKASSTASTATTTG